MPKTLLYDGDMLRDEACTNLATKDLECRDVLQLRNSMSYDGAMGIETGS
ncbi:hypothetical protein [Sphingomonas sp. PB1R3]